MENTNLRALKEFIISKNDFEKYFNSKKIINKKDYEGYIKSKAYSALKE